MGTGYGVPSTVVPATGALEDHRRQGSGPRERSERRKCSART
jgi:hypothetical protein